MRTLSLRCAAVVALLAGALMLVLPGCGGVEARAGEVLVLEADGVVNPVMERYLARGIAGGEAAGVSAVLVELDTPGGLESSMRDIVQRINASRVPVIVYVSPEGARAASAGTFITMAGHVAAMAPGTNIGAASPVDASGRDIEGTMGKKVTNDAVAFIRSTAEQRGRNADWAEQAVREAAAVSATEAVQLRVVDLVAGSRDDLLRSVDGRQVATEAGTTTLRTVGAPVREVHPSPAEDFLDLISDPNIAFLLLSLGGLALMMEIFHPGAVFPAVFGTLSIVLALFALGTLPANWAALALFGLAFACFALEVVVSSFGLLGVGGAVALVLGGLFLVDADGPEGRVSVWLAVGTAGGFALFFGFVLAALVRSRRRPALLGQQELVGARGAVLEAVDPEGYVLVRGERWAARSAGEALAAGETVIVTGVSGLRLQVERQVEAGALESAGR